MKKSKKQENEFCGGKNEKMKKIPKSSAGREEYRGVFESPKSA